MKNQNKKTPNLLLFIVIVVIITVIIAIIIGLIALNNYMKIHPYAGLLILMILGAGIPISFVLGKLNIIDENIATIIFGTCWVLMIAFLILSFIFGWSNYFDISGSHPNDGSYP